MRDQIIEITDQFSLLASFRKMNNRREIITDRDGAFWMRVYPPMNDIKNLVGLDRQLCPWAMAAELNDAAISRERRRMLLDALENGQKTMRLYELPPNRIMFVEENQTGKITVWVD
jgi:hypothetical protein